MSESLSPNEVAIVIRARQIQKEKGLVEVLDVAGICKAAGISRKTGYQWAEKHTNGAIEQQQLLADRLVRLETEHAKLKEDFAQVSFENRGRKLAWEIHGVDELLAVKKNTPARKPRKKQ